MQYHTVFVEVVDESENVHSTIAGCCLLLLILIVAGTAISKKLKMKPVSNRMLLIGSLVFICFTAVAIINTVDYSKTASLQLSDELIPGHADIAEGPVENYAEWSGQSHTPEHFDVQDYHFIITLSDPLASHKFQIREGEYVRVTHVGSRIIKFEMAQ